MSEANVGTGANLDMGKISISFYFFNAPKTISPVSKEYGMAGSRENYRFCIDWLSRKSYRESGFIHKSRKGTPMKGKKLFSYDFNARRISREGGRGHDISLVSEVKLPPLSKKFKGICAGGKTRNFSKIPVGSKIDIAFGDPRILKNTTLLSKRKKDVPRDIRVDAEYAVWTKMFTFEYRGRKFWVDPYWICLLEDLQKRS